MSMHLVFNGIDDATKARLESYWAEKLPRLQKLLVPDRTGPREIRLTVSRHQKDSQRSWYEGRAVVQLPTGTLAAEANDDDPQVVLDRLADVLVAEVKRHEERVRRDYLFKRKDRNRADLSAAGPILQKKAEKGRREDFFEMLRKHIHFLRPYARRELRSLELGGLLHRGEVTVDDLLDEVLARAWERFSDRPRNLPLDLWLTDLLDDTLEEWIKQEPRRHASLEERADKVSPTDEGPREDEDDWWAPLLGEEETLTLGDLIPDADATEAWEQLDAEEKTDRLLSLLRELPKHQRQAFLLHALENVGTAEIAMLQGRPEGEVKADIEAARRTLKERLLAGGDVREAGNPATAASAAGGTAGS